MTTTDLFGDTFTEDTSCGAVVAVLVAVPLEGPFDYRVPADLPLAPGDIVEVPFGPRLMPGVVWDHAPAGRVAAKRLKTVERKFACPPLPPALRALIEETARTTLSPMGACLKLALAVPAALEPPAPKLGYRLAAPLPDDLRLTAARSKLIEVVAEQPALPPKDIAQRAKVSAAVVKGMIDAGALHPEPLAVVEPPTGIDAERPGPVLSGAQADATAQACAAVRDGGYRPHLLEGVPGAGKTEVYFEAVAEALRAGRQVLVLLPEIALSAQWLARFTARFGTAPSAWHSELTAAQRRGAWRRIAEGKARVVVGARSALFLPLTDLGLIVVDEEHDSSFKQDDGVSYHARDMALARARAEPCPIILASATPSLESAHAAGMIDGEDEDSHPYRHLLLPERHRSARLPDVALIDLKEDKPPRGAWLAPRLREALQHNLARGEQSLLFLNRRGYAPLTLCRSCGHRLQCPNCSAWLVLHRLRKRLQCHHCGYAMPEPEHCNACGTVDAWAACGPGVERLAEEVREVLPRARCALMTSDELRRPADASALVEAMDRGVIDVLIGTQLVAKGHHFPNLTLVGVVDGDLGLAGGDLRAAERQFQLLYQVAGRAGRADKPGRCLVQTFYPQHPVMQALVRGERARFYRSEYHERKTGGLPPCGQLAALIFSGPQLDEVRMSATRCARDAPGEDGVRVLGPAPAPLALLRGRHRQRLLVRAHEAIDLPDYLRRWLSTHKPGKGVRVQVDINPQSFL